jgi:hypothetical protein
MSLDRWLAGHNCCYWSGSEERSPFPAQKRNVVVQPIDNKFIASAVLVPSKLLCRWTLKDTITILFFKLFAFGQGKNKRNRCLSTTPWRCMGQLRILNTDRVRRWAASFKPRPLYTRDNCPLYRPNRRRIFLVASASRPALGPTQAPAEWVPESLPGGKEWLGSDTDHAAPPSADVKEDYDL